MTNALIVGFLARACLSILLWAIVSGCSFSPVYSDANMSRTAGQAFRFAEPRTRLEQIIYQNLALRFPAAPTEKSPELVVSVSAGTVDGTKALTRGAPETLEATITATAIITQAGLEPISLTRSASASYGRRASVLAENEARVGAERNAAIAVSESLRLAILAVLVR